MRAAAALAGFAVLAIAATPAVSATPAVPAAQPVAAATPATRLALSVHGNHLIDASGRPLQLRGANISGLENTAVQGWASGPEGYNNWGDAGLGAEPDWSLLRAWHMNAVRLPLNESSWLGDPCVDPGTGVQRNPDPGGNYRATVRRSVADAVAAGLYVILDLHWSAPGKFCATGQSQMADQDNSLRFWASVAGVFKDNPAVIFELFNEPFGLNRYPVASSDWAALRDGGLYDHFVHQDSVSGALASMPLIWQAAGMQTMLDAVRATGATNVVLAGTMGWNGDLRPWSLYAPRDPIGQLAVAWHVYPWHKDTAKPAWSGMGDQFVAAANITTQYPIVITETGLSAPLAQSLLPWADGQRSVSYLYWSWNPWGKPYDLIRDAAAQPTGFGAYYKAHLACVAAGTPHCP